MHFSEFSTNAADQTSTFKTKHAKLAESRAAQRYPRIEHLVFPKETNVLNEKVSNATSQTHIYTLLEPVFTECFEPNERFQEPGGFFSRRCERNGPGSFARSRGAGKVAFFNENRPNSQKFTIKTARAQTRAGARATGLRGIRRDPPRFSANPWVRNNSPPPAQVAVGRCGGGVVCVCV